MFDRFPERLFWNYLPNDIIYHVLKFLDILDLVRSIRVNKTWYFVHGKHEDEFWLNLVRYHFPFVEDLTKMWITCIERDNSIRQDFPRTVIRSSNSYSFPPPTTIWRHQFQRYFMLRWMEKSAIPMAPFPPLSDYIFLVDLVLLGKNRISSGHLITEILDTSKHQVELSGGDLILDLSHLSSKLDKAGPFDDIEISVHVLQRKTLRQACLYRGSSMFDNDETMVYETNFVPSRTFPMFSSSVELISERCLSYHDLKYGDRFFEKSNCRCCCLCSDKVANDWNCFHCYQLLLNLFYDIDDDVCIDDTDQFLLFLDRGLSYPI